MKKETKRDYFDLVNRLLYEIHLDISKDHSIKELSSLVGVSPFHLNRIFKSITNESLHSYIRRIRLEHSANALLFNPDSTITSIMQESGFASNSSFTHAFKSFFGVTPTKWREVDIPKKIKQNIENIKDLKAETYFFESKRVAYVRHKGYDRSIKNAWMRLMEFCLENSVDFQKQEHIGLHHSNPNIVKKEDCRYVACVSISDKKIYPNSKVGIMDIPKIFCVKFSLKGVYGDLLKYMDYIYYKWLPSSSYEKSHLPSLAKYRVNHFINNEEKLDLDFYLPVRCKI